MYSVHTLKLDYVVITLQLFLLVNFACNADFYGITKKLQSM